MRLTCPNCAARYEIADDMLPPEGRDVECSNCGQVWFQAPDQGVSGVSFDPQARPSLNRQLNESMLSILREEAARELEARAAERQAKASTATTVSAPEPTDSPENAAPEEQLQAADPFQQADWPATTITEERQPHLVDEATVPSLSDDPPMALPDAEVMAATLTPTIPPLQPTIPPTVSSTSPEPEAEAEAITLTESPAEVPPATAASRKNYWLGFSLPALIAAALVLAYIAAPQIADDSAMGRQLQEWREAADHGRNWLHQHAASLYSDSGK